VARRDGQRAVGKTVQDEVAVAAVLPRQVDSISVDLVDAGPFVMDASNIPLGSGRPRPDDGQSRHLSPGLGEYSPPDCVANYLSSGRAGHFYA
jgi:hypothetical protein